MKRFVIVLILTGALGSLFLFGLTPRNERDVRSVRVGRSMPDFEMDLFPRYQPEYGPIFRFSDQTGTPMVVNFWASWCYPACYNEAPILEAASRAYRGRVLFVGVDTQDNDKDALEFLDRFQFTFANGKDPNGRIAIEWGTFGVPETFFILPDGTLHHRHVGEIDAEQLEQGIQQILASPAASMR